MQIDNFNQNMIPSTNSPASRPQILRAQNYLVEIEEAIKEEKDIIHTLTKEPNERAEHQIRVKRLERMQQETLAKLTRLKQKQIKAILPDNKTKTLNIMFRGGIIQPKGYPSGTLGNYHWEYLSQFEPWDRIGESGQMEIRPNLTEGKVRLHYDDDDDHLISNFIDIGTVIKRQATSAKRQPYHFGREDREFIARCRGVAGRILRLTAPPIRNTTMFNMDGARPSIRVFRDRVALLPEHLDMDVEDIIDLCEYGQAAEYIMNDNYIKMIEFCEPTIHLNPDARQRELKDIGSGRRVVLRLDIADSSVVIEGKEENLILVETKESGPRDAGQERRKEQARKALQREEERQRQEERERREKFAKRQERLQREKDERLQREKDERREEEEAERQRLTVIQQEEAIKEEEERLQREERQERLAEATNEEEEAERQERLAERLQREEAERLAERLQREEERQRKEERERREKLAEEALQRRQAARQEEATNVKANKVYQFREYVFRNRPKKQKHKGPIEVEDVTKTVNGFYSGKTTEGAIEVYTHGKTNVYNTNGVNISTEDIKEISKISPKGQGVSQRSPGKSPRRRNNSSADDLVARIKARRGGKLAPDMPEPMSAVFDELGHGGAVPAGELTAMLANMTDDWASSEDELNFAEESDTEEMQFAESSALEHNDSGALEFAESSAFETDSDHDIGSMKPSLGLDALEHNDSGALEFAESSAIETDSEHEELSALEDNGSGALEFAESSAIETDSDHDIGSMKPSLGLDALEHNDSGALEIAESSAIKTDSGHDIASMKTSSGLEFAESSAVDSDSAKEHGSSSGLGWAESSDYD